MKRRKPVLWQLMMIGVLFSLIIAVPFGITTKRMYCDFTPDDLETIKATYQYYEETGGAFGTTGDCKVFFSDADFMWVSRSVRSSEFINKMDDLAPGTIVTMRVLDDGKSKDIVDLEANGNQILELEESRKMRKRDRIGYDIILAFMLFPVWWALYKIVRREVIWWKEECFDMYNAEENRECNRQIKRIYSSSRGLINTVFRFFWFAPQKYEICDWYTYECIVRE